MKTCAFVFARGGSKGLPRKNIKLLNNKPLINYSIEIALQSSSIDCVFVSTDDDEIAQVANDAGAIVIKRPEHLATDISPEWLAWQHAIKWVYKHHGAFECFVSLPATSPLRATVDVDNAIVKLNEVNADICISTTTAARNPYFNMVKNIENNKVSLVNGVDDAIFRRQDAPEVFDMTTVVYASKCEYILTNTSIFDGNVTSINIPKERAIDIDDVYDFMLAEAILKRDKLRC